MGGVEGSAELVLAQQVEDVAIRVRPRVALDEIL